MADSSGYTGNVADDAPWPTVTVSNLDKAAKRSSNLQAILVANRKTDGVRYFLFRVFDHGEERFFTKRYSDFQKFHERLKENRHRRSDRPVPDLPESNFLGIGKFLDDDFNERRKAGLQCFVNELCQGLRTMSDDPLLTDFFGPRAPGRVHPVQADSEVPLPAESVDDFLESSSR